MLRKLLILIIIILAVTACGQSDFKKFRENLENFISSEANINQKEFDTLIKIMENSNDDEFKSFKSDINTVDQEKARNYIIKYLSAKNIQFQEKDIWKKDNSDTKMSKFNINIFLENSASMDGYVKGVTEFETAIYNMLGDFKINGLCDSLNLNYINKSIPYQKKNALAGDIQDFIEKLEPSVFKQRGGDRSVSDLKNILSTVLQSVNENNASVLISDFVFSPGNKASALDYLNNQGVGIKIDFAEKLNAFDLSVVVIQLQSNFDGVYYDKTDNPISFRGKRPYYVWLFGSTQQISSILNKKVLNNIKGGYLNRIVMESIKETIEPGYKINYSPKIGNFSAEELNNKVISDASPSRENQNNGLFGFTVAVDFSNSLQDSNYFSDTANYVLSNKNYELTIETITSDKTSLSGFTHLLKLQTSKLQDEVLRIEVIGKTPNWVFNSTSIDDSNILNDSSEQQKTFGLQYLIEGVTDAFYPKSESNAINSISITIKK